MLWSLDVEISPKKAKAATAFIILLLLLYVVEHDIVVMERLFILFADHKRGYQRSGAFGNRLLVVERHSLVRCFMSIGTTYEVKDFLARYRHHG
jgi:hypothetical protein